MKLLLFFSLFFFACSVSNTKNNSLQKNYCDVLIDVTSTSSYCGGAHPSDELLEQLRTPTPIANLEIFIREGEINDLKKPIIFQGKSDANGKVNCKLPRGNFVIVFKEKSDEKYYNSLLENFNEDTQYRSKIDVKCLNEYIQKPDLKIEVGVNSTLRFSINKHQECSWSSVPCSAYQGPLPPSAPQ
jgi:hypothetical protein